MTEEIGVVIGFVLTLMIFSYLIGDNVLYRLAVYIFVGLTAAFITIVTIDNVIRPWIDSTLASGNVGSIAFGVVPLILGFLLLLKGVPRLAPVGNLALGLLIGVGAAVAVVGAISGTLLPLTNTTAIAPRADTINGVIIVLGVICTLIYFQYLARRVPGNLDMSMTQRSLFGRWFGTVGQGFIVVTLGALYGGAILTGLVILIERVAFILMQLQGG